MHAQHHGPGIACAVHIKLPPALHAVLAVGEKHTWARACLCVLTRANPVCAPNVKPWLATSGFSIWNNLKLAMRINDRIATPSKK
eukprot:365682-Chlamydomonas_euryale.AAC.6